MSAKVFGLEEISKHNKEADLWVAINGQVYDVTKFANEHPGGSEILVEHAGTDATGIFEDIGHSNSARELMEQFKVGSLRPSSPSKKAKEAEAATVKAAPTVKPPVPEDHSAKISLIAGIVGIGAYALYYYYYKN